MSTSPQFHDTETAIDFLKSVGRMADDEIDIVESALAFAYLSDPDLNNDEGRKFFKKIQNDLSDYFLTLAESENSDGVQVRAKALKTILSEKYGFIGDDVNYDDLRNVNICTVMDRRLGLPITLSILAIGAARAMGWQADGINFPGHFVMRLDHEGERILIDPFQGCKVLEAKDLRLILKRVMGEYAELSSDYYEPCTNREALLRLQNNIKYRLIDTEDYEGALNIVTSMTWIAPDDYRLHLDQAVLLSRTDQPKAAIDHIKFYLGCVTDPHDKAEAEVFLYELQKTLN